MSDALDSKNDEALVGRRRAMLAGTVAVAAGAGTLLAGSPAAAQTCEPPTPGAKEIVFAVSSTASFESLVGIMNEVLTLPELHGIKGCSPCLSWLDRFAFISKVLQQTG
jgi:hypothetical protein